MDVAGTSEDRTGMAENLDILIPVSNIEELLGHVKCPVCNGHMTMPITFCEDGHNLCRACKESRDTCPTCSRPFSGIRNINLEEISSWSSFACPNANNGCPVMHPVELMTAHLSTCTYKKATCPLDKIMSIVCPWKGLLKDMIFHCKESHNSRVAEGDFVLSTSTTDTVNLILYDNEMFVFHKRFLDGKFYCAVEKVGITQRMYSATFILDTLSGFDRITVSHAVNVMSTNLDQLLVSGKFLKLNEKLLKRFISDGKLALQVMISKSNLS